MINNDQWACELPIVENPLGKLWRRLQGSTMVAKCIYECVKLAGIAMIFILGSVEYVGVFNIVAYVKNKHKKC